MNIPAALVSTKDLVGNKHAPATFPVPIPGTVTTLSFSKLLNDRSGAADKVRPSDDKPRPAIPVKQTDPRDAIKDPRDRAPRADTGYGDTQPVARKDDGARTGAERTADDSKVPAKDGRDTLDTEPQMPADAKSTKTGSTDKPHADRSGDAATSAGTGQADEAAATNVGGRGAGAVPVVAQATAANATAAASVNGLPQALTAIAGAAATQAVVAVQTAADANRGNARSGSIRQVAPTATIVAGAVGDPSATAGAGAVGAAQGQAAATGLLDPTQSAGAGDGAPIAKRDLAQLVPGQQADAAAGSEKTDAPGGEQSRRTTPAFDRSLADLVAARTGSRPNGSARPGHATATTAQQPSQPQAAQSQGGPQGQTNATAPTVAVPVAAQPQDRGGPTTTRDSIDPLKVDGSAQSQGPGGAGTSGATAPDPLRGTTQARAAQQPTTSHPAAEQVAVRVQKAIAEGNDRIHIRLKPAALGRVDIKLEVTHDGRVMAVVTTSNPATLNLLKHDAGGLTQALQDAGLKADSNSLSFNLQGGNHGGAGASDGGFGRDGGAAGDGKAPFVADRDAEAVERIAPYRALGNGLLDIHV